MKFALSTLGIAILHRLLSLAIGLFAAYESEGHPLRILSNLITFPLNALTGSSIDWTWRDEVQFILLNLAWGLVFTSILAITLWKSTLPRTGLLLAGGLALIAALIFTVRAAPPSFSELRRVKLEGNMFELPIPFQPGATEGSVHRFDYKNGQASLLTAKDEAAFRERLNAASPGSWKRETENADWILETNGQGRIRILTTQNWRDRWFGLIAEEKAIPRATAIEILRNAAASCARTE